MAAAHNSDKNQAAAYKAGNRRSVNKIAKLASHIRKNPNDAQAKGAVKDTYVYESRKPLSRKWRGMYELVTGGDGKPNKLFRGHRAAMEWAAEQRYDRKYRNMMKSMSHEKWVEINLPQLAKGYANAK